MYFLIKAYGEWVQLFSELCTNKFSFLMRIKQPPHYKRPGEYLHKDLLKCRYTAGASPLNRARRPSFFTEI